MAHSPSPTIRRSVALPADLVDEALKATPADERPSFNALVRRLLEDYVRARRARAFAAAMEEMAHDPAIVRESAAINDELSTADDDGLDQV